MVHISRFLQHQQDILISATILQKVSNNESVDLISVDQIWLSELAEKQILTDLTNFTDEWGISSDWYQANWDGGGKICSSRQT